MTINTASINKDKTKFGNLFLFSKLIFEKPKTILKDQIRDMIFLPDPV